MPSFASRVREELARLPLEKDCCILSELSALTQTSGMLSFRGGGKLRVTYRVESATLAKRIFLMLRKGLSLTPTLHYVQKPGGKAQRLCVLTLDDDDARDLLLSLHMMERDEDGTMSLRRTTPRHPMTRQCCRRAFLRGAWLGAGTMTSPEKSYHFEWKAEDDSLYQTLGKLLARCDMPVQSYERQGHRVIYLKGAQQITDLLALMGASQAVLSVENLRVGKEMRAQATRAANCDEHNGERMLNAAQEQARAIRMISIQRGLFTLPPGLRELARLRIENTDVSLQELGEMMDPPVSKSGVNSRMRRLMKIAEDVRAQMKPGEEDEEDKATEEP